MTEQALLSVENLTVQFRGDAGWVNAIEGVDFAVGPGECLGIVGESGSGKSVSALSILKLHSRANTRYASGAVRYDGRDLLTLPNRQLRRVRGGEIAMIFQDPFLSTGLDCRPDHGPPSGWRRAARRRPSNSWRWCEYPTRAH